VLIRPSEYELLLQVGILDGTEGEFTAFQRWGRCIFDDTVITREIERAERTHTSIPVGGTEQEIRAMTKKEQDALRDRVLADELV
jgi:hypothetical protein